MGRVIKIKIRGRGADTDAPKAEDLLDQMRDYLEIFRGVEAAVAEDGQTEIEWRVINATKNSPLELTLEAFPAHYGTDITRRASAVVERTASGLAALQRMPGRPPFFTENVLKRVERTFDRLTNGLDLAEIDFGPGVATMTITAASAHSARKNTELALKPVDRPYRELGTFEGIVRSAERDGHGRKLLWVQSRLTGDLVKCILSDRALAIVGDHTISEVYAGRRAVLHGSIHYKGLGNVSQVEANNITFPRARDALPTLNDILDEDFTGGLRTEEYLDRLRDGRLS